MRITGIVFLLLTFSCGQAPSDDHQEPVVEVTPLDGTMAHLCITYLSRQPDVTPTEDGLTVTFPTLTRSNIIEATVGEVEGVPGDPHCQHAHEYFFENVPPDPEVVNTTFNANGYEEDFSCTILPAGDEPLSFEWYQDRLADNPATLRFDSHVYTTDGEALDLSDAFHWVTPAEAVEEWTDAAAAAVLEDVELSVWSLGGACADVLRVRGLTVEPTEHATAGQRSICRIVAYDHTSGTADSAAVVLYPGLPEHILSCAHWEIPTGN